MVSSSGQPRLQRPDLAWLGGLLPFVAFLLHQSLALKFVLAGLFLGQL